MQKTEKTTCIKHGRLRKMENVKRKTKTLKLKYKNLYGLKDTNVLIRNKRNFLLFRNIFIHMLATTENFRLRVQWRVRDLKSEQDLHLFS